MKRSRQLDLAKEVALPGVGKGVYTTVGDLSLNDAEKAELDHKLNTEGPFRREVERICIDILTLQTAFLETTLNALSDDDVRRFNCIFDGAIMVARVGDSVLATLDPFKSGGFDPQIRAGVITTLADMRRLAQGDQTPQFSQN